MDSYFFAENHKTWDWYIHDLPQQLFTQKSDYSLGSVRNHLVHLMDIENAWFSGLSGVEPSNFSDPIHFDDRNKLHSAWDIVEENIRSYLSELQDDMLIDQPLDGEDKDLMIRQVLLQVVNHGTDHRAQILRLFHDMGVKTGPQD
ncbi:MAG: DinB family protein [Anaerolineaceae bacterium]|nr:DinB family protein [Anaerolineaceae bacterium]